MENTNTPDEYKDTEKNFWLRHPKLYWALRISVFVLVLIGIYRTATGGWIPFYNSEKTEIATTTPTRQVTEKCTEDDQLTFIETTGEGKSTVNGFTYTDHTGTACPPKIFKTGDKATASGTDINIIMYD